MAAELFTVPFQCVVVSGLAVPGATITFYRTQTSTKLVVYTTAALDVPQTNPVVANSTGRIPATYLDTAETYRIVIKNKAGTVLDGGDIDPYIPGVTTLGITLTSAAGAAVNSKGALAALSSPTVGQAAFLTAEGEEGMFVCEDYAAHSAAVTADTQQGTLVRSVADTSKVWARPASKIKLPGDFNAVGDNSTDDSTELQAWLDSGGTLGVPVGCAYSADNLILRRSATIEGAGYGFDNRLVDGTADQGYDNQPGSRIRFAAGKGFQAQPQSAQTDETATIVVSQEGAFNAIIRNLALIGANTGATVSGFYGRSLVHLDNVHVIHFTGKGFDISAALGPGADASAEYGNASLSSLRNCHAISNGSHAFHIRGGDANVVTLDGCNASLNGGWGFLDESGLGSTYNGCHSSVNTSGSYKCIGGVSNSTYNGCYVEPGVGQAPDLSYRCTVNGGLLADIALAYNVGSLEHPTIIGAAGFTTDRILTLRGLQALAGALTDRCVLYRHADQGLVLQGVPDAGGTYTHAMHNQADESVLLIHKTTKGVYIQGPILIAGTQVVGAQLAAVTGASYSVAAPTQAEFNAAVDVINAVIARMRSHGLIAT